MIASAIVSRGIKNNYIIDLLNQIIHFQQFSSSSQFIICIFSLQLFSHHHHQVNIMILFEEAPSIILIQIMISSVMVPIFMEL